MRQQEAGTDKQAEAQPRGAPSVLRPVFRPADRPAQREVSLTDYRRILLRRRWIALGVPLVVVLATAIHQFRQPDIYTAAALLQIDQRIPRVVNFDDLEAGKAFDWDPGRGSYYETQYRILAGRAVAARVIRRLGLAGDATPGAGVPTTSTPVPGAAIDSYLGAVEIVPVESSQLVEVRFRSQDPELAARVATTHVMEFIQQSHEDRFETATSVHRFLQTQLSDLHNRIEESEATLSRYRKEHEIHALPDSDGGNLVVDRLADLNRRLTEAQAERMTLETRSRLLEAGEYDQLPETVGNPLVTRLKEELANLTVERARLSRRFTADHPRMIELNRGISVLERRLEGEFAPVVQRIAADLAAAREREKSLAAMLDAGKQQSLELKERSVEYQLLQNEIESNRELYATLLKRLKETGVTQDLTFSNLALIEAAEVPSHSSSPQTQRAIFLALLIGTLFGVGAAFFADAFDDSLDDPGEAEDALGLPVLGVVPMFENGAYGKTRRLRPLRLLRSRIEKSSRAARRRVRGRRRGAAHAAKRAAAEKTTAAGSGTQGKESRQQLVAARQALNSAERELAAARARGEGQARILELEHEVFRRGSEVFQATMGEARENLRRAEAARAEPRERDKEPAKPDPAPAANAGPELVTITAGRSVIADAYRSLRTTLLFARAGGPPHTFLVTSSSTQEGKTVTAVNLAVTLAQSGKKVLLVDADLRNPRCHRVLQAPDGVGLTQFLTGQCDVAAAISETAVPSLFLMGPGARPPSPTDLIGSRRMAHLLHALARRFDFVVIDTPPVLPVSDALLLSGLVDGVILVVKAGGTRCHLVREARRKIEVARGKILGLVLNAADTRRGYYYYYYYHHYYPYSRKHNGADTA